MIFMAVVWSNNLTIIKNYGYDNIGLSIFTAPIGLL